MSGDATASLIHYWHEKVPPQHVVETLVSFEAHNPDMEQLIFDESSAAEFIEVRYGAREATAFRACAVPAMQADYFRYCAVHSLGGVYADANFRCLESLRWLIEGPEKGILFGRQDPVPDRLAAMYKWPHPVGPFRAVTNSMFGFRDYGHPLLGLAVQASTANIENRVAEGAVGVWITTGPGILTSIYLLHELGSIDAFIEYSVGSVIESSAPLLCEVVEDYARVASAWDGVDIRPLRQREAWGIKTHKRPQSTHWLAVEGTIYR